MLHDAANAETLVEYLEVVANLGVILFGKQIVHNHVVRALEWASRKITGMAGPSC